MTNLPPDQLFLAHLPFIKQVAMHVCRRHGFSREDTEDFISKVQIKLMEDDYAVFRKHKGKSTLPTYLNTVIQNFFKDHLDSCWGRWRPSQEAKRLGPLAIQLEKLMSRDRLTLAEACETLLTHHPGEVTRQELEELAAKLPYRPPRPTDSDEIPENPPSQEMTPAERLEAQEWESQRQKVLKILKDELGKLSEEDALLAKMSCEHKVSDIARTFNVEQKPLYRRLEKILNALRQALERRGVRKEEISGLLDGPEDEGPRH
jgi:RNA polymerase sigma factor (sigma-70 family)